MRACVGLALGLGALGGRGRGRGRAWLWRRVALACLILQRVRQSSHADARRRHRRRSPRIHPSSNNPTGDPHRDPQDRWQSLLGRSDPGSELQPQTASKLEACESYATKPVNPPNTASSCASATSTIRDPRSAGQPFSFVPHSRGLASDSNSSGHTGIAARRTQCAARRPPPAARLRRRITELRRADSCIPIHFHSSRRRRAPWRVWAGDLTTGTFLHLAPVPIDGPARRQRHGYGYG